MHTNEVEKVEATKENLKQITPNLGFISMVTGDGENTEYVSTRLDGVLVAKGSPLNYRAGLLAPNIDTSTKDKEQFNKYPCNGCPENLQKHFQTFHLKQIP